MGVVSASPADTPPAFESREYGLFFQEFDNLILFTCRFFIMHIGWVVNHFCVVINSEHILYCFTQTLIPNCFTNLTFFHRLIYYF